MVKGNATIRNACLTRQLYTGLSLNTRESIVREQSLSVYKCPRYQLAVTMGHSKDMSINLTSYYVRLVEILIPGSISD
jgi:hypothetical protein